MPNSEGVVHGHIHNFNNITYIHGHVHRTSSSADLPLGLFKDQDTVDIQSAPVGASGPRDATGSLQFAPGTAVVPSGSSMPATGFGSVTTDDPAPCLQYKDCQHFEFMNYHDLNIFGEGRPKTAPDELLIRPDKKRKVTSCPGQPRVVELCCEDNHTIDSAEPNAMNNDDLVLFANGGVPECPTHETTAPVHSSLPNFIDCDLTCAPTFSEEDELFESLCAQCVDLDQHDPSSAHEHSHTATHEQCSQQERPHSYNQGHTQQCHADEQGHVPCASSQSTSGHYHVINASTDMKIIEELANISNMYDFPFGKHVHSHDTGKEDTKGKEDNYNLLQTCLPEVKTESLGESYKKAPHHHHHHRIEVHSHPPRQVMEKNDPNVSNERATNVSEYDNWDPAGFGKLHHRPPHQTLTPGEMKTHTVNFNWNFKTDESKVNCNWNQCPQVYDSLIDLQSHILKDHINESSNTTKLPTPRNQYDCEWQNCGYEGDDICALVNHINGEHGIAFDMKFLDRENLEEQSEQHHLLHCGTCHTNSLIPNEPDNQKHICRWDACMQEFSSCEELNTHIEKEHIPRGKSSYVCGWENCGRVITQRQKLLRHLRVHTRYKPCKCVHCLKTFSTQDILQQHMRTHSGEKPYKCSHCGKGFATSSSLRIHIRTHTGEKPLECKVCGKRFNESSNLSKHMRTHERKYKCQKCKRSFDFKEQLEVHQSRCS